MRSYTLTKSSSSNCKCSLSSFFSSLDSTGSFSWKAELFREWKLPFQWRWTPVPPPPRWFPLSWPREGPCQPGWLPESPTWAPLETPESTESWRRRDGWCQQSKQKEICKWKNQHSMQNIWDIRLFFLLFSQCSLSNCWSELIKYYCVIIWENKSSYTMHLQLLWKPLKAWVYCTGQESSTTS